ncbi:MAG: GGDEF domain-containing protein [Lachnospiraceae bacterium]|nr:GGDEF domain-containing protein [Lachnospiraceae bacterium]
MTIQNDSNNTYYDFYKKNRINVNILLNKILWFCVMTGPAIALGIYGGIFHETDYGVCIQISVIMFALSTIHFFLIQKYPDSYISSCFALIAINLLLVQMSNGHVAIYITWFFTPLLALLFCDLKIYYFTVIINYIMVFIATWLTSPYFAQYRTDYDAAGSYFVHSMGGYTIETIVMVFAGTALGNTAITYFRSLIDKYKSIAEHMHILNSMTEIYTNVNLLDLSEMTELNLTAKELNKKDISVHDQSHTAMVKEMSGMIMPDQYEEFMNFTNISTLQYRLQNKKLITADFINRITGWFRAQYIVVNRDEKGIPYQIIFTVQDVEAEKRREEHLLRIAMTDELTRLYNRRSYDEDIAKMNGQGLSDMFAVFSVDINGLKKANDSKGHIAGDELIKGASDTLLYSVGKFGKVYRTGGDEFMALVEIENCNALKERIKQQASVWKGQYNDFLSLSIGYASIWQYPNARFEELEKQADKMMYDDKENYYSSNGLTRR